MSDDEDPPRWRDGAGPEGALELVRALERPPVLPPVMRARPRLRARRLSRRIGAATATALVIGALVLWIVHRPSEPEPALPAALTETLSVLLDDAGSVARDAGTELVLDAGLADAGAERVARRARRARAPEIDASVRTASETAPAVWAPSESPPEGVPTGTLWLETRPHSIIVVDGVEWGLSPQGRRVRAGWHRFEPRSPDGATFSQMVEVRAGETVRVIRSLR